MIRTGYFAKHAKLPGAISIALYPLKGVNIPRYSSLSPTPEILYKYKNNPAYTKNDYIQDYQSLVLNKLDVHKVASDLDGKILLCFEKSGSFCHRHLVSEWLQSYGYSCSEIS